MKNHKNNPLARWGMCLLAAVVIMANTVTPALAFRGDPEPRTTPVVAQPVMNAPIPAPSAFDQNNGLLWTRYGVRPRLQSAPLPGFTYLPFDWSSLVPTLNADTIDWVEGDWYGNWPDLSNHTDFDRTDSTNDWYPSGGEPYDIEAIYMDNDDVNLYFAAITSIPFLNTVSGETSVGIGETRIGGIIWVRPGDLDINLFKGTARAEGKPGFAYDWHYNYGLDVVHENRDLDSGGTYPTRLMRDLNLGNKVYKTNYSTATGNQLDPAGNDWYVSLKVGHVGADYTYTNFDPFQTGAGATGITYVGDATYVSYYRYDFPGGLLENNSPTYVVEGIIPLSVFGADRPVAGDLIGLKFVEGCRNDGNENAPVLHLIGGDFDDPVVTRDFGDLPDGNFSSTNNYNTSLLDDGARHVIQGNFKLGSRIDSEVERPASGSDDTSSQDDEDGIKQTLGFTWQTGTAASGKGGKVDVTVNGCTGTCYLSSWMDWNQDGDFWFMNAGVPETDANEGFLLDKPVVNGTQTITFDIPVALTNMKFYARFRLYSTSTVGTASYKGEVNGGEVEDHFWGSAAPTAISLVFINGSATTLNFPIPFMVVVGLLVVGLALVRKKTNH